MRRPFRCFNPFKSCNASNTASLRVCLALWEVFVGVWGDFFGLAVHDEVHGARGISGYGELAQTHHSVSKIAEDRDEHGEMVVHSALRDFRVDFSLAAFGGLQLIFKIVMGDLGAIDPLVKKPIEMAIALKVHLLGHVLFGDGYE